MARQPLIVGIGGTTRAGSSTEAALRMALHAAEQHGAECRLFSADQLAELPMYTPQVRERSAAALDLVDTLRRAEGVIIASPGYHGSVSGLVKNALDYTEDMRGDDRVYLSGVPVGLIATGSGHQGIDSTLSTLRDIAHALRGWTTPLGVSVKAIGEVFDERGNCVDEQAALQLRTVGEEVVTFARWRCSLAPA